MKALHPQILAAFLQLAPLTRVFQSASPRLLATPAIAILRWIFSASAVAGSMHAVSGSSGIAPTAVRATNGVRVPSTRFITTDSSHGTAKSYSVASPSVLPPGLALSIQGVLSGTPTQGGTWTVAIRGWQNSNQTGDSATKNVSFVVVNTAPPVITTPPTNVTVAPGGTATFTVGFTGDAPVTLRWFKEDLEVAGGTNATLNLTGVTTNTAGRYRVRLVNSVATIFSDFVTLTVQNPNPPPTISAGPVSQIVHAGETVQFSATATGSGLTYAWTHNNQSVGSNAASLVLTNVTSTDAGTYAVRVTNAGGSAASGNAILTVLPALRLESPGRSGDALQLRFTGVEGRRYLLESAPDLLSTFTTLTEVLGHSTGAVATLPTTNATRVFRLRTAN